MWPKKSERSGKRVDFWLSESEHLALKNKATIAGLSVSKLIRQVIQTTQSWTAEEKEIEVNKIQQLARIGNNLNQIARFCNTHKSATETAQVLSLLVAIEREIKKVLG